MTDKLIFRGRKKKKKKTFFSLRCICGGTHTKGIWSSYPLTPSCVRGHHVLVRCRYPGAMYLAPFVPHRPSGFRLMTLRVRETSVRPYSSESNGWVARFRRHFRYGLWRSAQNILFVKHFYEYHMTSHNSTVTNP